VPILRRNGKAQRISRRFEKLRIPEEEVRKATRGPNGVQGKTFYKITSRDQRTTGESPDARRIGMRKELIKVRKGNEPRMCQQTSWKQGKGKKEWVERLGRGEQRGQSREKMFKRLPLKKRVEGPNQRDLVKVLGDCPSKTPI